MSGKLNSNEVSDRTRVSVEKAGDVSTLGSISVDFTSLSGTPLAEYLNDKTIISINDLKVLFKGLKEQQQLHFLETLINITYMSVGSLTVAQKVSLGIAALLIAIDEAVFGEESFYHGFEETSKVMGRLGVVYGRAAWFISEENLNGLIVNNARFRIILEWWDLFEG